MALVWILPVFWRHSYLNAWVLPAGRAEEHLGALRAALCHGWLLVELC